MKTPTCYRSERIEASRGLAGANTMDLGNIAERVAGLFTTDLINKARTVMKGCKAHSVGEAAEYWDKQGMTGLGEYLVPMLRILAERYPTEFRMTETHGLFEFSGKLGRNAESLVWYDVFISKAYFPKELWRKGIGPENEAMYSWRVKAPYSKRSEAALQVWQDNGKEILREIQPWVKRVSLNVSGGTGMGSVESASRLSPVQVYPVLKA